MSVLNVINMTKHLLEKGFLFAHNVSPDLENK